MKVLFWTEYFFPHIGGIEVRVGQLARALMQRGHECGIVTCRYAPDLALEDSYHGAAVHRLDFADVLRRPDPRTMGALCLRVAKIREAFQPDVNHLFLSGPLVMLLQMTNRGPSVPTITSVPVPVEIIRNGGAAVRRLFAESAAIVAVNRILTRGICDLVPEAAGRTHLVPNCVVTPVEKPKPLPQDPPVLLGFGRLVKEKGFDTALEALAQLDDRWCNVRMIITGDGEERKALEKLSRDLGVSDRVEFTGPVPHEEVPAMINRATLVVVPSRWEEPFGIVCLESQIMGRPVVASRVGGIPEVVLDGETGLLVEKDDPAAMARAIEALIEDPVRLAAMGTRAREWAEAQFGFEAYVEKHLAWYGDAAKDVGWTGSSAVGSR